MKFYAADGSIHRYHATTVICNIKYGFSKIRRKLRGHHKKDEEESLYEFTDVEVTPLDDSSDEVSDILKRPMDDQPFIDALTSEDSDEDD